MEQWRPIPGHDGYEASDLGRIRSLDRRVPQRTKGGVTMSRLWTGRILAQAIDGAGYWSVGEKLGRVHILVMLAFVGPCPDGLEVCHNDGDHRNVALLNLRYDTRKANVADLVRHGKAWWLNGFKNPVQRGRPQALDQGDGG
jgi:hypothetical protein